MLGVVYVAGSRPTGDQRMNDPFIVLSFSFQGRDKVADVASSEEPLTLFMLARELRNILSIKSNSRSNTTVEGD